MSTKTLFITDIHGCYDEMLQLITQANADRVICCGDLIDRGPKSREVVQYIIDNNIECVLGNHELMAIEAHQLMLDNNKWALCECDWYLNGGKPVFNSYPDMESFTAHIDFFKSLPIYIDTKLSYNNRQIIAAHTNIFAIIDQLPTGQLTNHQKSHLVWNRAKSTYQKEYLVIHGHTPTDYYAGLNNKPYICEHSINIDTGCAYKTVPTRGTLTGLIHPSMEVIQT